MGLIILPNTSRDTDDPNLFSDVYDNDAAIAEQVNGELDNSNIASAASIALSKLAQGSSGAVTFSSGATSIGYYSKNATGDTTVGTSNTDITGATTTVAAGTYLAIATFDFLVTPDTSGETTAIGDLHVNGATQGTSAILDAAAAGTAVVVRASVGQSWIISVAGSYTVKLVAHREDLAGTGAVTAYNNHTGFRLVRLA